MVAKRPFKLMGSYLVWFAVVMGCNPRDSEHDQADIQSPEVSSEISLQHRVVESSKTQDGKTGSATNLASDTPGFRGKGSSGVFQNASFPTTWDEKSSVRWRCELNGRGASSPIAIRKRVFVTTFSGYGENDELKGNRKKLAHHLTCLDQESGEVIWTRRIRGEHVPSLTENNITHGFASSTPVSDGKNVFVFFGTSGVFSFDFDGNLEWAQHVGCGVDNFGSSASLTLHRDLVLVNASVEEGKLYALEKKTGKGVWFFKGMVRSWSTPVIAKNNTGAEELLINNSRALHSLNPLTGECNWTINAIDDYVVSTPITHDGICYLTGGKDKKMLAVKMGVVQGQESRLIWEKKFGANVGSPVFHEGKLYVCADNAILQIIDAATGSLLEKIRIRGVRKVFASPILCDDLLFIPTVNKGVAVFSISDKCRFLRFNSVDQLELKAGLAVDGDKLFLRNNRYLYCIAKHGNNGVVRKSRAVSQPENEQVNPLVSLEFDEKTGKPKRDLAFLKVDAKKLTAKLIKPYASVITPTQTNSSQMIVESHFSKYVALREQLDAARWGILCGSVHQEEFAEILNSLESSAQGLNRDVRKLVKKMFSKQQLEQHLREAEEFKRRQAQANTKMPQKTSGGSDGLR